MATRDDLKALIDRLPESCLEHVGTMLEHNIHPRPPAPAIERLHRRFEDYKMLVERRFRETRKPGTIGGMTGGGSAGMHEGTPFGRIAFHYWDDRALVHQTLQSLDGREIELMERFSVAADRTALSCTLELSSGGHTVQHQETFPLNRESQK
jgi:hypothetical protein